MWGDGRTLDTGNERHAAPDQNCHCGWYGWKDRQHEAEQQPRVFADASDEPWAEVDFYGKVIEHEWGYRASRQRVMAIHLEVVPPNINPSDLARAIGIPIVDPEGIEYK